MGVELNKIPLVDIDSNGVFKYILVRVHGSEIFDESTITIVRGYQRSKWHTDIFEEVQFKLSPFDLECLGGGKINHDADAKKLHVYGHSQGYGKADHEITAQLLKEFYKDYTITIGNDGD